MKGLPPPADTVCGFCNSKYVPSYTAVAIAVVVKSLAANAAPPTLTIVLAATLLTLRVGVVVVLAAVGSQLTLRPAA